jgi:hypothetical protein
MFSYAAISILPHRLLLVSCVVLMCTVTAIAQGPEAPSIRVVDDIPQQTQESVRITFTVKGASKKRIRVRWIVQLTPSRAKRLRLATMANTW